MRLRTISEALSVAQIGKHISINQEGALFGLYKSSGSVTNSPFRGATTIF